MFSSLCTSVFSELAACNPQYLAYGHCTYVQRTSLLQLLPCHATLYRKKQMARMCQDEVMNGFRSTLV